MGVRCLPVAFLRLMMLVQAGSFLNGEPSSELRKLRKLEDRFFKFGLKQYPELATHIVEHAHDDILESFTMATFLDRKVECDEILADLSQIDLHSLDSTEKRDLQILKDTLETFVEGYRWRNYGNLNTISFIGGAIRAPSWISNINFNDQSAYDKYLKRLKAFPVQINQRITLMKLAMAYNRTSHEVSVEKVPELLAFDKFKNLFYKPFERQPNNIPNAKWDYMVEKGIKLIDNDIKSAYEELQSFIIVDYLPLSRRTEGVFSWQNGLDYYKACLKWHVGIDVSPDFVHSLGRKEVDRILRNIQENVMNKVGFHGTLTQFFQHVQTIPEFFNHSADYILGKYNDIVHYKIQSKLFSQFKQIYVPNIRIVQLPYYGPWGSYGDNTFYINSMEPEKRSTLIMLPLTLHEVSPGHHFQVAYANHYNLPEYRVRSMFGELYAVPFLIPSYQAYTEGWALYAEYLGEEMGLFDNPYDLFGRYCSEIFRACRLVVDTGIHAFGWSRQEAIEYIANYTTFPLKQIEIEVDRYITWPGQSVAYKMGEIFIKKLRTTAEDRLGKKFDIKEFHDQVLKHGRLPLSILTEVINDWTKTYSSSTSRDIDIHSVLTASDRTDSLSCDIPILVLLLLLTLTVLRIHG